MCGATVLTQSQSACFVIADISGYTSYLAGVELDHAQDILADLMDTVLHVLRPPFRLAKIEGDALFVYAVTDKVDGTLLQDAVEAAYFAFRRRLRDIDHATSCECQACRRMATLDLKFVAHYGKFVRQKIGGRQELAGADVIIVHRLLKNAAGTALGGRTYALFSEACVSAMAIDPKEHGLVRHVETIESLGEVVCWLRDLESAWQAESDRKRVEITRDQALVVEEFDFDAPRPILWEYITRPELRRGWQMVDEFIETTAKGRRGVGTRNHCTHGKDAFIEEIVDWRPFDYVSMRELWPVPGAPWILTTTALIERDDGGTQVEVRIGKVDPNYEKLFTEAVLPKWAEIFGSAVAQLRRELAAAPPASPIAEPALPASAERFLTEPVHLKDKPNPKSEGRRGKKRAPSK